MGQGTWTPYLTNMAQSGTTAGSFYKTSEVFTWENAGIWSVQGYQYAYMSVSSNNIYYDQMFGLTTVPPGSGISIANAGYVWHMAYNGTAVIYIDGSYTAGSPTPYTTSTVFSVIYDGREGVKFYQDNVLIYTYTGYAGGSLLYLGSTIIAYAFTTPMVNNLVFGPLAPAGETGPTGETGATGETGPGISYAGTTGAIMYYGGGSTGITGSSELTFTGTLNTTANILMNGTGALKLPVGSTGQRPSPLLDSYLRVNSDTLFLEICYGGIWYNILSLAPTPASVNYLVVAGGGGGGSRFGGGGGAGGFLTGSLSSPTAAVPYTVTVGNGGAGGPASGGGGVDTAGKGTNGSNSVFASFTAIGGGGGAAGDGDPINPPNFSGGTFANSGGCGGGGAGRFQSAGAAGTLGQGNAGGSTTGSSSSYCGGGGGGAGAAGTQSSGGGIGLQSSISGTTIYYAGGGGGGGDAGTVQFTAGGNGGGGSGRLSTTGDAGQANTGGGGGGGGFFGSPFPPQRAGGNGGSGIVILSYPETFNALQSISIGLVYTSGIVGSNRVYTFTSGSGTISW